MKVIDFEKRRIINRCQEIFGQSGGLIWLQTPNDALNGGIPAQLIDTPEGQKSVNDLLIRIEYGVFV